MPPRGADLRGCLRNKGPHEFAFLQGVHYAVWLRWVPEDDRVRPAPRTFASSWRALRANVGVGLLAAAVVGWVAFAVWGVVDAGMARTGYLRVAAFHGWLEWSVAVGCLLERRRPGLA